MLSFLKTPQAAQWGSASLVVLASAVVGRQAALGMDQTQVACSGFAVLGSIGVAVMVRVWPAPQKVPAQD